MPTEREAEMTPKTILDKIVALCKDIEKPTRQAIKKALAEHYDCTNEAALRWLNSGIKKALLQGVKTGKLFQEGQTFYTEPKPEFEPEPETWTPLHPDKKHYPESLDFHGHSIRSSNTSMDFPNKYHLKEIRKADNHSFWKFAFHLQELCHLYKETGDHNRADGFQIALDNMLDLSNYDCEHKDKYGNYIGIGEEDMLTNMLPEDVKCLRDIYGVGVSTVKLIEEWIETGTMKRLEDMRKEATPSITERVRYTLNSKDKVEAFEAKHDYIPDFLKSLGKLADLYEKEDRSNFVSQKRANSFRRAIIALEGQIISAVEDIKLFVLRDLKGVGKATLGMLEEFIKTGKIEKLEEMRPKTTKEEWDTFIKHHEPLRQYFLDEELLLDFEEFKVVITCGYHERELDSQLTQIIENDPDEYPDERIRKTLRSPPVYDIEKLKRSIEKYDFRLFGCEEYIFEGYIKHGDITTHPFSIGFTPDDSYGEWNFKALGWTPAELEEFLHHQLFCYDKTGGWEKRLQETRTIKEGRVWKLVVDDE